MRSKVIEEIELSNLALYFIIFSLKQIIAFDIKYGEGLLWLLRMCLKGSDREERRWIEKNNRVQRAEKKKEEMKRIRKLVDNAYNSDTRIARFKEEDRQEKAAKKKAKADAIKQRKEAEEKERREAEEKVRINNLESSFINIFV